ncbi:hydroxylysine kinase-like [Mytilus californianus]|uniref:hydroxylysine kinase-like n=1 Tax=Mytilus californianus TaxID=6549 RepID=UPI0022476E47|nr:hydroxylysine kinase-like [Mytilus californianus]XP_052100605.1 hydroxylysine kinase-like [Mytilus californianus]XP_052100606.1 hydroxylysine kinase-like [Mytilus californianus]XP_052100607.1 hydroxylysine kinase-like [Mytilus californianus]XP_052100608.1 hydroxylysine kinase-like [Mytilus californianus]XP_052100609.1 hydroxylysine kinase-like [Mytilus californianus]
MTEGAQRQSQHIKGRTEDQVIQLDTDESKTMLKPNQQIRPLLPNKCIRDFALKLYGMNVLKFEELDSFEDRNYHIIVDPVINNNYIKDFSKTGYVLKVLNLRDSKTPAFIEAQHSILEHLRRKNIPAQEVVQNVEGRMWSLQGVTNKSNEINSRYIFHMMKYMEGEIAITKPYVPVTLFNIGKFAGRLQNALEDFDNAFLRERVCQWNLAECPRILDFVFALKSKEYAQLVNVIIKEYIKEVKPVLGQLRKVLIHGDLNENNILVKELGDQSSVPQEKRTCDVIGIIDFFDMHNSYTITDIAILITHMSTECKCMDSLDAGGHILAGYLTESKLTAVEIDILRTLICCRIAHVVVMSGYTLTMDPDNKYVSSYVDRYKPLLWKYWNTSKGELHERWITILKEYGMDNLYNV